MSNVKKESLDQRRVRVLDALGSYQKSSLTMVSGEEIGTLVAKESDRGIVVILGSMLEDILLTRVKKSFVKLSSTQEKDLVRSGGLISTFDDRINLCRALGLIDDEVVEMLRIFKSMRNACAHSRKDISFTTPQLKEALALMFEGETGDDIRNRQDVFGLRSYFIISFVYTVQRIMGSDRAEAHQHAQAIATSFRTAAQAV